MMEPLYMSSPKKRGPKTRQEALETKEYLGEADIPGEPGSAGGKLQRKKGTKDEQKRARERPAGATRVHKSDEKDD